MNKYLIYSLIHGVVRRIIQIAHAHHASQQPQQQQPQQQQQQSIPLTPSLVETYSRLLVYNEIEQLGIKEFISKFLVTYYNKIFDCYFGRR